MKYSLYLKLQFCQYDKGTIKKSQKTVYQNHREFFLIIFLHLEMHGQPFKLLNEGTYTR